MLRNKKKGATYSNFKVDQLLCKCAHLVVEAESVFPSLLCCEDGVELPLLAVLHDGLAIGSRNCVVDIEGAARLDLDGPDRGQCWSLVH